MSMKHYFHDNDQAIKQIQAWTDKRHNDGKLGFGNAFPVLEMTMEFKVDLLH